LLEATSIFILKTQEDIKIIGGKVFKCGFSKNKYNEKISVQEGLFSFSQTKTISITAIAI